MSSIEIIPTSRFANIQKRMNICSYIIKKIQIYFCDTIELFYTKMLKL